MLSTSVPQPAPEGGVGMLTGLLAVLRREKTEMFRDAEQNVSP